MKKAAMLIGATFLALIANDTNLHAQNKKPKTINGKLDANDPPDPFLKKLSKGKLVTPHKVHTIKFAPNKTYVIQLKSDDFDAFLRVEDSKGNILAIDDDGGKGLNSRALFTSSNKDSYRVVVTSLNRQPGDYTLSVEPGAADIVLARSGILLKPSEIQAVKFQKGKTYVIDLSAPIRQFDTLLRVNDASGKQLAEDDDGGEGLNSRLRFTAPESADFQIVVTSFMGQGKGPYQLTVKEAK